MYCIKDLLNVFLHISWVLKKLWKSFNFIGSSPSALLNCFWGIRCSRINFNFIKLYFIACFCFVGWFWFDLRFCALKIFSEKSMQAWNCPDNLILLYYWSAPSLTYLWRIYFHVLIFIWENLFLFIITCENLFFVYDH